MYHYRPRSLGDSTPTKTPGRMEESAQERKQEQAPFGKPGEAAAQQEGPVFDAEALYLLLLLVERGAEEAALRERDTIVESDPREAEGAAEQDDALRPPRHRPIQRSSTRLPWMLGALGILSVVGMIVAWYLLPLLTASATVTIIPTAVPISATTSVQVETTGSSMSALGQQRDEVPGRILSSLALSQARSVPTSGTGFQPATAAHGRITFYNAKPAVQTVPAGTLLTGADGTQVVTEEQATLPPAVYPTFGQATVSAKATTSGPAGDIKAGEIYGPCCRLNLSAVSSAFNGGQNARSFPMVAQTDISGIVTVLKTSLQESAQAAFATELRPGETLLPPLCTPIIASDHTVGEEATRLGVTVTETCRGAAYEAQALHDLVTQAVTESARKHLGTGYILTGDVQIAVMVAARSTRQDTLPVLQVKGTGTWSYQFNTAQLHRLAHVLQGKTKAQATRLLLSQPGVSQVAMNMPGGSSTFPIDARTIHVLVLYQAG